MNRARFAFLLVFIVLLTFTLACSLVARPTATPLPDDATVGPASTVEPPMPTATALPPTAVVPPANTTPFHYNGIEFDYPNALAGSLEAQTVEEISGGDVAPWEIGPEYRQVAFQGYVLPDTFHVPQMLVYPVERFIELNSAVGDVVDDLRAVLANPAAAYESLPLLPPWNAAQLIHVQVQAIQFKNGSGIRYLTQYAQSASPINNRDLFYTFQGLTNDGQYYISLVLPVSHPSLPATFEEFMAGKDYNAFAGEYVSYLSQVTIDLNALAPESFTPSLPDLDAMLATLSVR